VLVLNTEIVVFFISVCEVCAFVFGARQSVEEKGKGESSLQLMVLESSFRYWLVMWVGRWEASHLSILISNVGGKVESQPRALSARYRRKRKAISPRLLTKNRSGMSHLLLRLFNRTNNFNIFYCSSRTAFISFTEP